MGSRFLGQVRGLPTWVRQVLLAAVWPWLNHFPACILSLKWTEHPLPYEIAGKVQGDDANGVLSHFKQFSLVHSF